MTAQLSQLCMLGFLLFTNVAFGDGACSDYMAKLEKCMEEAKDKSSMTSLSSSSMNCRENEIMIPVYSMEFLNYPRNAKLEAIIQETGHLTRCLDLPQLIYVNISDTMTVGPIAVPVLNAAFTVGNRVINIHTDTFKTATPENEIRLKASIHHEFAHMLFFINLRKFSEKVKKWYDYSEGFYMNSLVSTFPFIGPSFPREIAEISKPYQELFADLLAVLTQSAPNIFYDLALQFGFEESTAADRKFDTDESNIRWDQSEPHSTLAPVRHFLWANYFSQQLLDGKKAELLREIFDILANEVMERSENSDLKDLSPEIINLRVIEKLESGLMDVD